MFDNLISFLNHFDIPVLCMTATLPQSRREEIEKAGLSVFPTEQDRVDLQNLQAKEEQDRYQLHLAKNFEAAYQKAVEAYRQGKRVLWVVNTVDRCIAIAKKLEHEHKIQALTYHSRFTLADRQQVHGSTDEFTMPCILDRDLEVVKGIMAPKSQEKYRKEQYIINVPRKWAQFNNKPAWMPKYLGVAPSEKYSENRGFMTKEWQEVELG